MTLEICGKVRTVDMCDFLDRCKSKFGLDCRNVRFKYQTINVRVNSEITQMDSEGLGQNNKIAHGLKV
jgi:hypothetical protein